MIIYSSPSATFTFVEGQSVLILKWQFAASRLLEYELKTEVLKVLPYIKQYQIVAMVIDEQDYPLHNHFDLQGWFEFEYLPELLNAGIQRLSIVVPASKINDLLAERVESFSDPEMGFFSDVQNALQWLKTPD